ncbi:hypothetical protein EDB83DRAFT_1533738 [Lactarius deliciosus]|nr:hypothetical protein EDB83DRAFT_1533738 [Lactarius deliciosus]
MCRRGYRSQVGPSTGCRRWCTMTPPALTSLARASGTSATPSAFSSWTGRDGTGEFSYFLPPLLLEQRARYATPVRLPTRSCPAFTPQPPHRYTQKGLETMALRRTRRALGRRRARSGPALGHRLSPAHLQQLKPTSYARYLIWHRRARRLAAVECAGDGQLPGPARVTTMTTPAGTSSSYSTSSSAVTFWYC